ncbi:MAG: helix-turn-helix transcriptional regulator [Wenzhouxiangella sp.]
MSTKQSNVLDSLRDTLDYELANVEMDFTDSLETLMQRREVSKSELARRIETSPAYITKILRGSTNFTLETMVKLVRALDGKLHVRACAKEDKAKWFHVVQCGPANVEPTRVRRNITNRRQYRITGAGEVDNELAATA